MKKRILALILSVLMLLSAVPLASVSALMMGDVDGDGTLSASDARSVLRASVNLEVLEGDAFKAADVDRDGKLTAADARSVLRASVNLENLHTHSFSGAVTTAATCEAPGVMTYSCECGEDSYTEAIPATGHTVAADAAVAPTCTVAGKTAGTHCSVCNAVISAQTTVPATGHVSSTLDASTVKAVTCKEDGYSGDKRCNVCGVITEYGSVIYHTENTHNLKEVYVAPTCEAGGYYIEKCTSCEHFDADSAREDGSGPVGHSWLGGGAYTTVAPTCEDDGYDTRTCSVEKCSYEEKINYKPALTHDYSKPIKRVRATCLEAGYEIYECTKCGDQRTTVLGIAECKPADSVKVAGTPGGEENYCISVVKCSVCKRVMSTATNYGAHEVEAAGDVVEATCVAPETQMYACKHCDYTYEAYRKDALGHSNISSDRKAPTCDEDGYMIITGTCTRCGEGTGEDNKIILKAKGHVETGVQTCTSAIRCTVCKKETKPALGHNYTIESSAITVYEASKTVDTFFCTRCGKAEATDAEKLATFNAVTGKIKTAFYPYSKLHTFDKTGTESSYKKFNFGIYTSMIKDMYDEDMANNPDTYSAIRERWVYESRYYPISMTTVSELTKDDVDSITVERLSGVQFSKVLADFDSNMGGDTDKLSAYKAKTENRNVIKVTVDVKNESFYKDIYPKTQNGEKTALQKIYNADFRSEYEDFTMNSSGKLVYEMTENESGLEMTMKTELAELSTDCKVTYYFLEETYEPIIAIYDAYQTMEQNIDMSFKMGVSIKGEMVPVVKTRTTTAYIFLNYIPVA